MNAEPANRLQAALSGAVLALLYPLCRLLLRHHVPYAAFEELAKRVYVQVAMDEFAIPGRKPTVSRASILTGLTRKDVTRLLEQSAPGLGAANESYDRGVRVLTGWTRDADFCAADGTPLALVLQGEAPCFAELVRRYSGDMPVRAVLDELLRVGAVRQCDDQRLELVAKAYVPQSGEVEKLGILGTDVADLIATIDHNLQRGAADPRFQRKVMYRSMPASVRAQFRKFSAARAQSLLEQLDRWLAARDVDNSPDRPDAPRVRLGLGVYYFETPGDQKPPED